MQRFVPQCGAAVILERNFTPPVTGKNLENFKKGMGAPRPLMRGSVGAVPGFFQSRSCTPSSARV
ncbi:MAG TPA: hypothetical protein VGN20_14200 [Mucilaginibacter sp.]|jgi:hypothetical protein